MARMSSLRASDADREKVADRLRQAATEGRILAHELEDRVATALCAQTYGELDAVVADLPGAPLATRPKTTAFGLVRHQPVLALAAVVAVCVVATVLAAVAFVASGGWIMFMMIMFALRGSRGGRRRHTGRGGHSGSYRELSRGQVQVHVHHHRVP